MNIITFTKDDNTFVTKNFKISEFSCPCKSCYKSIIDTSVIKVVQFVRDHFGVPVKINSAYRCILHNPRVGGSSKSQHLLGKACDIVVQGILPEEVQDYLIKNQTKLMVTIGRYDTFTHVDVRTRPIIFDKRSKKDEI